MTPRCDHGIATAPSASRSPFAKLRSATPLPPKEIASGRARDAAPPARADAHEAGAPARARTRTMGRTGIRDGSRRIGALSGAPPPIANENRFEPRICEDQRGLTPLFQLGGALEEERALAGVPRERRRPLEFDPRVARPPELREEIAADARQ